MGSKLPAALIGIAGLLASPCQAGDAGKARGATPRDPQLWAANIQQDYPAAAFRSDEEGTVTMRIDVDESGTVSTCIVEASSGSAALDAAACQGMTSYAEYYPALNDEAGHSHAIDTICPADKRRE